MLEATLNLKHLHFFRLRVGVSKTISGGMQKFSVFDQCLTRFSPRITWEEVYPESTNGINLASAEL